MLKLRRAPSVVAEAPPLDDVQQAALAHRGGVLRVLGGPGTGKTTTAIEAVVARVESGEATPDQCLILTSSRVAAGQPARAGHGPARGHLDRAARAHPPGPRVRHPAPGRRAARRPDAAAAQRPRAGRHPARAAGRPRRGGHRSRLARAGPPRAGHPRVPRRAARPADARGRARPRAGRPRPARPRARPPRVGRRRRRAGRVRRGHRPLRARRLRPGVDPRRSGRPARGGPRGARAAASTGCGWSSSTTPRSSPRPRPACCARSPRPGIDLVLLGDPDSAVQTFRGADPRHLSDGWTQLAAARPSQVSRAPWCCPRHTGCPQAVVDAAGEGRPQDRRARRRCPARSRGRTRRGPGRRAAAARREPGGELRRRRAARVAPAVRHPVVGDGRHRARAGPHRDACDGC